jgi:hypothetical protein
MNNLSRVFFSPDPIEGGTATGNEPSNQSSTVQQDTGNNNKPAPDVNSPNQPNQSQHNQDDSQVNPELEEIKKLIKTWSPEQIQMLSNASYSVGRTKGLKDQLKKAGYNKEFVDSLTGDNFDNKIKDILTDAKKYHDYIDSQKTEQEKTIERLTQELEIATNSINEKNKEFDGYKDETLKELELHKNYNSNQIVIDKIKAELKKESTQAKEPAVITQLIMANNNIGIDWSKAKLDNLTSAPIVHKNTGKEVDFEQLLKDMKTKHPTLFQTPYNAGKQPVGNGTPLRHQQINALGNNANNKPTFQDAEKGWGERLSKLQTK